MELLLSDRIMHLIMNLYLHVWKSCSSMRCLILLIDIACMPNSFIALLLFSYASVYSSHVQMLIDDPLRNLTLI